MMGFQSKTLRSPGRRDGVGMFTKARARSAQHGVRLALVVAALAMPRFAQADPLTCTVTPGGAPAFTVELVTPVAGETAGCFVEIRGHVKLASPVGYDVYVVLDSSGSTAGASGLDLDGDGVVGEGDWRSNTDPDDSTLAAELEAVRRAVAAWEAGDVRVSLEEYSAVIPIPPGEPSEQGRIRTVQGLTANHDLVRAGLDTIWAAGPRGATDYGGALLELAAEFDRSGDLTRKPVAFYLSDGKPTFPRFPYDTTETPDVQWARDGANVVAVRKLPVNTFEVGVFDDVGVLAEVADITGGRLIPELQGEALLDSLTDVSLDGFLDGTLENVTHAEVYGAELDAFGNFSIRIPLHHASNDLVFTTVLRTPNGQWDVSCPFNVTADCMGCTFTPGWWKNHHRFSPNQSQFIPWPIDELTQLCGQGWLDILWTPVAGNTWIKLAHHWITSELNYSSGAYVPDDIAAARAEAELLLADCVITPEEEVRAEELSAMLTLYDEGLWIGGPPHCLENPVYVPPADGGGFVRPVLRQRFGTRPNDHGVIGPDPRRGRRSTTIE